MGTMEGFRDLPFLDQISLLSEVEQADDVSQVDDLLDVYVNPTGDSAVDTMVRNTLRGVMKKHVDLVLKGLDSDNRDIRTFSMNIAGELELADAAPKMVEMAESADSTDALMDVLSAMARIRAQAFLSTFQKNLTHDDSLVAALSVEMAGAYGDESAMPTLKNYIECNEDEANYEVCDVTTWQAIDALASINSPDAVSFLADKIHHRNPTARRIIHEALERIGASAVDEVAKGFANDDVDVRIMTANVLGNIGDKAGAAHLIQAMDDGRLEHPNLQFAAYEALGKIPGMKSLVFLMDALGEVDDDLVLIAVTIALNGQMNPGVAAKLKSLAGTPGQGDKIIKALVASKADAMFPLVYEEEELAPKLIERICASRDPEIIEIFKNVLEGMDAPQAAADAEKLAALDLASSSGLKRLLAIDDSKAMLNFYRSVASDLDFDVTCAENGQDALDTIEFSAPFDIIVVDMNMPVMDGIEFTGKVRTRDDYKETPIVMATTESAKSQAQLAKKAGVSSFLRKPFTFEVLQNKIQKILA